MKPADNDLIGKIVKRDSKAFEQLYSIYEIPVRHHLQAIVREENAAEDLLQETFLRVWNRITPAVMTEALKAWIFRIATNLALNYLRTLHRRREQPLESQVDVEPESELASVPAWMMDPSSLGPDALAEQVERHAFLSRFVEELPETKREVVRLLMDSEMEISEMSNALGIPRGTVKSRLHYARKELSRKWETLKSGGKESEDIDEK